MEDTYQTIIQVKELRELKLVSMWIALNLRIRAYYLKPPMKESS